MSQPITITEQIAVAQKTAAMHEYLAFKFKDTHQATLTGGPQTLAELERQAEVSKAIVETLKGVQG